MQKRLDQVITLVLVFLTVLLVWIAILSLKWRFQHDQANMLYLAFLMDKFGFIPYRDFFDFQMPGAYLAYALIGRVTHYTDIGQRIVDIFILALLMGISFSWMKRLGWKVAWCGSVLWGLVYLGLGPEQSLQREYLILLFVLSGIYILTRPNPFHQVLKSVLVGFLFGVATVIKPQAAIGLLPVAYFEFQSQKEGADSQISGAKGIFLRVVLPGIAGFSLPLIATLVYLGVNGALAPFLDIILNYWPLYTHLTDNHVTIAGLPRIEYYFDEYRKLGGFSLWMAPATVGAFISLYHSKLDNLQRRQVALLIGMAVCYGIYPLFTGQFWKYHWFLFLFFSLQISSLCLVTLPEEKSKGNYLFPVIILFVIFGMTADHLFYRSLMLGNVPSSARITRSDEIANFLTTHLEPGDTVQPLDWMGGALDAMLKSRAKIATPFVYDFYFYHHVSSDYIQGLRKEFIKDLVRSNPRFVIRITRDRSQVSGEDTTRKFVELNSILEENYKVLYEGNGYIVFELEDYLLNK